MNEEVNEEDGDEPEKSSAVRVKITGEGMDIARDVSLDVIPQILALILGKTDVVRKVEPRESLAAVAIGEGSGPERPLSVVEYYEEKNPRSVADSILTLAMYAEQHENRSSVTRKEIRRLFKAARLQEPSNLPRDVSRAVQKGYLLEVSKGEYQVTKKGIDMLKKEAPFGRSSRAGM